MTKFSRFVVINTYKAFKMLFLDIIKFLRRVVEPLTFPWATSYMTKVYYELTAFYLNRCKTKGVPFIEPVIRDLAYTAAHIKETSFYDDMKNEATYTPISWIKVLLAPYSAAEPYKQKLKGLRDKVSKHNEQFKDAGVDDIENKMMDSLDVYNSVFGRNGFYNE